MSIDNASLDRRAYGQARRYIDDKHRRYTQCHAGVRSSAALSTNPSGGYSEIPIISKEADIPADHSTSAYQRSSNPASLEHAELAGIHGRKSDDGIDLQKWSISDYESRFPGQEEDENDLERLVSSYNVVLQNMRVEAKAVLAEPVKLAVSDGGGSHQGPVAPQQSYFDYFEEPLGLEDFEDEQMAYSNALNNMWSRTNMSMPKIQ